MRVWRGDDHSHSRGQRSRCPVRKITAATSGQFPPVESSRPILSQFRPDQRGGNHHEDGPHAARQPPRTPAPATLATSPDSKLPNSLEAPINRLFTADTRPRISSGVSTCTSVFPDDHADVVEHAQDEHHRQRQPEGARQPENDRRQTRSLATASNNECPAFCMGGRCARVKCHHHRPDGCRRPQPAEAAPRRRAECPCA